MSEISQTFEEQVSEELDAVYQGALFLAGGDEREAESLVVDAVRAAYESRAAGTGTTPFRASLDRCLVRVFLEASSGSSDAVLDLSLLAERPSAPSALPEGVGPDELFAAASAIPPAPRAALWLVVLRRWGYDEAAAALEVERDQLRRLLRYRDLLLLHLSRSSSPGRGISGLRA